jgi:glycosyltransferase involved in cell wall biosynthesis
VWTLIRALGLEDRVQWTGFLAPEQVSAHLLAADMAVLPYREGANLRHGSLHAALAHGLPVVTTRPPDGLSELTDGENASLAPPDDPAALAGAVAALAGDGSALSRLSAGALALARRYGWEGIAESHVAMYRRLAPGDA